MTAPLHATTPASGRLRPRTLKDRFLANGSVGSIALFFAAVVVLFSVTTDAFLSLDNILNILRQSAPLLIVATAMTLVITTGGIDLSVGSVLALTSALCAILIQAGLPWVLVVALMLLCGALVGSAAGVLRRLRGDPGLHRDARGVERDPRVRPADDRRLLDPHRLRPWASSTSAEPGCSACLCRR